MSNIIDNNTIIKIVKDITGYENMGLRRIPMGEYLKLKKNAIRVYAILQRMSYWNPNGNEDHRYIPMWQFTQSYVASELNLTRNTIGTKLKELKEVGLIKYITNDLGEMYMILPNVGDYYVLVDLEDKDVKDILVNYDSCLLRTYLFHKSFSVYANKKGDSSYTVTLEYIAETIGFSTTNLGKITDANRELEKRGIITIEKSYKKDRLSLNMIENNTYTFNGKG